MMTMSVMKMKMMTKTMRMMNIARMMMMAILMQGQPLICIRQAV